MTRPVVIIGAGPAGLSCASRLASQGRSVVLIDENLQAGGQYFRQLPPGYSADLAGMPHDITRYRRLSEILTLPEVRYMPSTVVWSAPSPLTIAFAGPEKSGRIDASAVVIATGAQDKPLPFPGWTLPGVISAGGSLNLVKAHGLVPSGKVLLVGNGPLVLVAAATLISAGANVIGVAEVQKSSRLATTVLQGLTAAPKVLLTALQYRQRILRAGAWFRTGWMIAQASGQNCLQRAAIAPIGAGGRPVRDRQQEFAVDTLVVGYGLLPSTDCARLMGCEMSLDRSLNGVVPVRSETFETSIPNVYAIGDGAGIGGVEVALLEGELAASAILQGATDRRLSDRYRRLDRFRRRLNSAYAPSVPLVAATGETLICRCEEISLAELTASPLVATGNLDAIKTSSRLGMGRCQGRNCLPAAPALLGWSEGALDRQPRVRPPLRPVQLSRLAADADAAQVREPDESNITERR